MAITEHSITRQKSKKPLNFKEIRKLPPEEIDKVPFDELSDALFAKFESEKKPILTAALIDQIEEFVENSRRSRKMGLAYLTRPWGNTAKKIEKDRGFAVATANVAFCVKETIDRYKALVALLECSHTRMLAALCSRKDMEAVIRQGEKAAPLTEAQHD